MTLVPLVWRLLHRRTSRIFQQLSTPDILRKVLGDAGVPADRVALHLTRSYKPRDYCVQYRESDLAFLSRLMEEEGIFYFFEHAESGHTLIVGDSLSAHRPVAGDRAVPFRPVSGALRGQECVSRFRYSERIRPGRASLRDYGFEQPRSTMAGSAQHGADSDLEIYDYPGEHDHPADADRSPASASRSSRSRAGPAAARARCRASPPASSSPWTTTRATPSTASTW